MRKSRIWIPILVLSLFAACQSSKTKGDEQPLARVMDDYLYPSDLVGVVSPGTLQSDSIVAVQAYIHNWIQQKLLVEKAENNLAEKQKKFEKEIENYRNSLIVFTYQNALIEQTLDTVVTDEDIEKYYEENASQFLLKSNIVRVRFVKLAKENGKTAAEKKKTKAAYEKIYQLMFERNLEGDRLKELSDLCQKYGVNYYLDTESWLYFNELLKEIPIETYNQEDFLRQNRMFEVPEEEYVYYVNILDFRIKESTSPLSFERNKIATILLNNRKVRLIENLHEELMREGQDKKYYEIY